MNASQARQIVCMAKQKRPGKFPAPPIVYRLMSRKGFSSFEVSTQKQHFFTEW